MLLLPVNRESKGKREEREREGAGWAKIHQIWWHGDVDNVFSFQLSSEKRKQNTTTFALSHPEFVWLTCLFVHKHQTLLPIRMIAAPLCDLMVKYSLNPTMGLWQRSGVYSWGWIKKNKKKIQTCIIIQSLICLCKYNGKPLKKGKKKRKKKQNMQCCGNFLRRNIGKQTCWGNVDGFLRSESHSCLASRSWLLLSFIFLCNVHRCCLIQLENVAMVLH